VAMILSDSTERWDFAGIATDQAGMSVFGEAYKKVRLAYHQERLGIYYALVHASRAPDLLIEEDVQRGLLKDYDVAYWVGDCAEAGTLKALDTWMNNGGSLLATAGALRNDEYKKPVDGGLKLLGLQAAKLDAKEWFFRPQIELPRLSPLDTIKSAGGEMPVIALKDNVTALPTSKITATFADGKPAVVISTHGKGRSIFIAALPGVAYLWSAYQNAGGKNLVPTRGPSSHMELTGFNTAAAGLIVPLAQGVLASVDAGGAKIDARLLSSPNGYAIPIANYESDTSKPITLRIRGLKNVKSISSAAKGKLTYTTEDDAVTNNMPPAGQDDVPRKPKEGKVLVLQYSPGIGDILRIETQ